MEKVHFRILLCIALFTYAIIYLFYFNGLQINQESVSVSSSISASDYAASFTATELSSRNDDAEKPTYYPFHINTNLTEPFLPKFLSNLKNPCWYALKKNSTILRCLPYYLLIGNPKCGTTDIFYRISLHPDVVRPLANAIHWLSRQRFHRDSYSGFVHLFERISDILLNNCYNLSNSPTCGRLITGEGSPSTFWDSQATMEELYTVLRSHGGRRLWSNYAQIRSDRKEIKMYFGGKHNATDVRDVPFTLADVLHSVLPDARLLVILRDPSERAYSSYNFFNKKNPKSPEDFDNLTIDEISRFNDCRKHRGRRNCAYEGSRLPELHLPIGMYIIYLRDWLLVYPREQLLVIRKEDYEKDEVEALESVFRHLGLRSLTDEEKVLLVQRKIVNKNRRLYAPMLNRTRKRLKDFFAEFNHELAQMVKDDGFLWED